MTTRLIVVLVVAAVVVGAVLVLRRRPLVSARPIDASGLTSGVYLLTSDECDTCIRARNELVRRGVPHTELSWQKNPDVFERLRIDAVPSVIEVAADGSATWWRGGVPRRLHRPG
ncbi:MAG TPA: hypothetical protein VK011_06795 [Acidimicrobiia bacterium]|nr:hypothetical protein [Acidimicrobiia bacterium]